MSSDKFFFGLFAGGSFERVYRNCVQRKVFIGSILSTNKNNRKWLPRECITSLLCENWLRRSVFFFSASPTHCTIFGSYFYLLCKRSNLSDALDCVLMFLCVLCFVVACFGPYVYRQHAQVNLNACLHFYFLSCSTLYVLFVLGLANLVVRRAWVVHLWVATCRCDTRIKTERTQCSSWYFFVVRV